MSIDYPPVQKPYTRNAEIIERSAFPEGMHRVAIGLEYNGADFHGFQKQPSGVATVQQALEKALSQVANETVTLVCAGRTDAGVHATNQVIHFDTLSVRPEKAWVYGVNALLPDSVSVRWAQDVDPEFHARFSATNRVYRYVICNRYSRPALGYSQLTWEKRKLDLERMRSAASALVGEHDFTSFRASQCQAKSPVRTIHAIDIAQRGDLIVLEIKANAFLHHMVRNIVGSLLPVAASEKPVEWIGELLRGRDRKLAGATAKPQGLHLVSVGYPERFSLPIQPPGPVFFSEDVGGFRGDT